MPEYRVGVDVGGTFTDLVAYDPTSGTLVTLKIPSTPQAPERAVLDALKLVSGRLILVNHSSTIATNALLGQIGLDLPRLALLTTAGFRDVLEIGRQNRSEVYNLRVQRPMPLVTREHRYGIPERIDAHGQIITPLDEEYVRQIAGLLTNSGISNIAVCYLNSYTNSIHEQRTREILRGEAPELDVSLSCEINPEYREYERTSTTVIAALLRPLVQSYLQRLEVGIRESGLDCPLYVMQSNGGMADGAAAAERPHSLIESGPAAGVVAASALGRALQIERLLSFDMGGTTAKAGVVLNGAPEIAGEFEAAGRTHSGRAVRGSGYPVRFPFIDLAEVSAGGGTIAGVDTAGVLHVGPLSAGADPGPACYGRGGTQATVTDANLYLGRLPAQLQSGLHLHPDLAEQALQRLADRLPGMNTHELALGIIRIIEAEMAKVLRIVTIERGHDPRDFTLIAFGGAGPLHACALAADLGIPRILIPPMPGLFSAWGLLVAPPSAGSTQTILLPSDAVVPEQLEQTFRLIEDAARPVLERMGVEAYHPARSLDMRYLGQSWELSIPAASSFDTLALRQAVEAFHARHKQVYGYDMPDETVEIVTARTELRGEAPGPALHPQPLSAPEPPSHARTGTRMVYYDTPNPAASYSGTSVIVLETPVYDRAKLLPGNRIDGPALIEQYDSVTLIPPGWHAHIDAWQNIEIVPEDET